MPSAHSSLQALLGVYHTSTCLARCLVAVVTSLYMAWVIPSWWLVRHAEVLPGAQSALCKNLSVSLRLPAAGTERTACDPPWSAMFQKD